MTVTEAVRNDTETSAAPDAAAEGENFRSVWTYLTQVAFRQDYVDVGGVRTRYIEAGKPGAPAVVMLHGTGGHWEAFCANIGPYAEQFHVFAFDMKGAGFSDKPDEPYLISELAAFVKNFMTAVGIERASVVGVSLGAQTAARLAINYPESTDKVVLISPVGLARLHPVRDGKADEGLGRRKQIVDDTSWESTKSIFYGLIHDHDDILPDLVKLRQTIHRMPNAARDMANVFKMAQPDIYAQEAIHDDELRALKAPVLVFVSEHDAPFFRDAARVIAELAPKATLIELSDVAHWAQFEAADYFNEVTIEFLTN